MIDEMMKYLKTKQEIVEKVNFNKLYKTENDQVEWVNSLLQILKTEPAFLVLSLIQTKYLIKELDYKMKDESKELQEMKLTTKNKIGNYAIKSFQDYRFVEDYLQMVSLIYTNPGHSELTVFEIFEQTKSDYSNMKILFDRESQKLIGDASFLSTVNYTMTTFPSVYEKNPELLTEVRNVVSDGMIVNKDRKFKKLAKRTIKRIDKKLYPNEAKILKKVKEK